MDTIEQPLPERTKYPNRLRRAERKMIRTNRALASKGILVNPGENIQAAIDSLDKERGGIVTLVSGTHLVDYTITIPSFITLQGEGQDITIIDFNGSNFKVQTTGSGDIIEGRTRSFRIKDLTIQNSGATAACDLHGGTFFIIDNVRFSNNSGYGLQITNCVQFTLINSLADYNDLSGFYLTANGSDSIGTLRYTFIGCRATNNTGNGFAISAQDIIGWTVGNGAFVACEGDNNTEDGFDFTSIDLVELSLYLTSCVANSNLGNGFDLAASFISLTACTAQSNDSHGVINTGVNNTMLGCNINGNNDDFQSTQRMSVIGNSFAFGSTIDVKDTVALGDVATMSVGNTGGNTRTEKRVMQMKNTSGGTIAQGAIVSFQASAEGDEITTTTTQGDDKVFGMALFAISNNAYGAILVEGYTTLLKVDGTTDIAIGDLLGTFTTAGIAMKAAAGDMAIAYALEAYTGNDSNGVIDALVISPRKL